jgi:hypothetical protein
VDEIEDEDVRFFRMEVKVTECVGGYSMPSMDPVSKMSGNGSADRM